MDSKPITLYVVDDYLLTLIYHKRIFEQCSDFKLLGAFLNANECLSALEKQQADIILMDIELNGMNGIEATRIIKEKYPKTKVIMYSAFKNGLRILASLACGACGYILKKKDDEICVKTAIKRVMNGEFLMDSEIAAKAFSQIPMGDVKDLNNLSDSNELLEILTQRELEVLKLLVAGKTNSEIADEIIVSTNTAKAHVGNILTKLSVKDRVQAAVKAVRANIC